ncbi:MAG TPA: hypothetical protein VGL82_23165 [Bryobacteraceae bacterium]
MSRTLAGIVAVNLLAAGALLAQAPAPKAPAVKDQAEYDLIQSVQKEKDPQKQMDLLKQWEQKYPDSDFKGQRSIQMAQTEGQIAVKGLQSGATAADVDAAQKAAQDLIDNLGKYLAAANKPANVTDDQWKAAQQQLELQAHTVLGTIGMNKKTTDGDATAEKEFRKTLELSPGYASIAYQLGTLILRERKVERIPEALFYIARAIDITGPLALTAQGKQAAETYLEKAYAGYHGGPQGLDDVKKAAMSATFMPPDFKIESIVDIQKKEEGDAAAFAAAHPDIALWRQIRGALTAADGDAYFMMIKDSAIPPEGGAFTMFNAKVISQPSPKEILANVDSLAGDVTLKFETALKGTIDPGTQFKFKGVVDSFVKDPYMLTLTADKEDVDGLPASLFAAAPPARKRTTTKKK